MASQTQQSDSGHLDGLAAAELETATAKLADAGRTIDALQADALALAERVDAARAEAEQHKQLVAARQAELEQLRTQARELTASNAALEAHVARLKKQIESPTKLLAKKALKRGPYSGSDKS